MATRKKQREVPEWFRVPTYERNEWDILEPRAQPTPEVVLAAAVFGEAICDLNRGPQPRWKLVYADARAWVERRGRRWLYSFESVCDVLKLDVEATREALLEMRPNTRPDFHGLRTNARGWRPTVGVGGKSHTAKLRAMARRRAREKAKRAA